MKYLFRALIATPALLAVYLIMLFINCVLRPLWHLKRQPVNAVSPRVLGSKLKLFIINGAAVFNN